MKALRNKSIVELARAAEEARGLLESQLRAVSDLAQAISDAKKLETFYRRRYASALRVWKIAEAREMAKNPPIDPSATTGHEVAALHEGDRMAALDVAYAQDELQEAQELVRL